MDRHCLVKSVYVIQRSEARTHLFLGQDPADRPHAGRCPYDSMECNLTNRDQCDSGMGRVDDIVIENIIICIDKKRVFARWSNEDDRRRKVFYVQNGLVV